MNKSVLGFPACIAAICLAIPSSASLITQITDSDFTAPRVLDFESSELGVISGNDLLFTDFGIARIDATGSNFIDEFNVRASSSNALWLRSSGLEIVAPGTPSNAGIVEYTISFIEPQIRVGIGIHDAFPNTNRLGFELLRNEVSFGNIEIQSPSADLVLYHLENTSLFDAIRVFSLADNGFALDDITLDTCQLNIGDLNCNNQVDGKDFLLWQENPMSINLENWATSYGIVVAPATRRVPEPTTFVLLIATITIANSVRNRDTSNFLRSA